MYEHGLHAYSSCLKTLTDTPEFNNLGVDNWARRHAVLVRFASAARKVCVHILDTYVCTFQQVTHVCMYMRI